MRQESRYRPAQVSHTAALGLMQMIPKTAKVVGRALGVRFDVGTFFEPGRNVLFCSYYLAALLRDFRGQLVFASAAYNAGAPAIKRFLERHRGLPFDAMVEHIAYNEARNYCRKVAEHLIRYAYLHLPPPERAALYARLFPDAVDYDVGTDVEY
jgi:soluble lytic murein transglycosylase